MFLLQIASLISFCIHLTEAELRSQSIQSWEEDKILDSDKMKKQHNEIRGIRGEEMF